LPTPTPMALLEQFRMFARCPELFIQPFITASGVV
jgi:hypothetical protein